MASVGVKPTMTRRQAFLALGAGLPLVCTARAQGPSMSEELLRWAAALVREVPPERNFYGSHPTYVDWRDSASGTLARNRSVCSSFANHLLAHSFGYTAADLDAWFGKDVPQALEYHDTIEAGRGFTRVEHIGAIRPGDIVAIAYPPSSHPTGHVMIAATRAASHLASAPLVPQTQQYEIGVIDSANSGHGPSDTRRRADGTWTTGVGRGTLRLYGRDDGTIAGYAWSTSSHSVFREAGVRHPVVGRLAAGLAPRPSGTAGSSGAGDPEPESNPDDSPVDEAG